jgi:molybdenum cofactor cytidylyltransferase
MSLTVSAIILAAGSASRMGSPKQLLRLGSQTLLEHTLAAVRASQVREIVVVLGASADTIRPHIPPGENVTVLVNDAFQTGMGSSLQCGLAGLSLESAATLVVLADQPLVRPATLDRLIDEYLQHKPQILIPLYRGFRGNPVLLDRSIFPEIAALTGDSGCRAIFGGHLENIRKVEVNDPGILLDADRPPDLDKLREIYANGAFNIPLMETTEANLGSAPELVLVGRESVATALARFARLLDFRVTVVDPLLTFTDMPEATAILRAMDFTQFDERDPRLCVVASMGRFDEEAIEQATEAAIPYIALVANKKRSQEVLHALAFEGVPADRLARIRTKPGMSIGAQTSAEIALSIMAEIVSLLRQA